jgi:hypothetical protein
MKQATQIMAISVLFALSALAYRAGLFVAFGGAV